MMIDVNTDLLICPISQVIFKDPVISNDGFTYERLAIEEWLINNNTDPLSRNTLTKSDLKSNIIVKNIIDDIKINKNINIFVIPKNQLITLDLILDIVLNILYNIITNIKININ
jgi:hypothetical protein